jgi:hypothetical protein
MDVRLPDGTVIQNVPDGTTKAQLIEKLKANGHDVSGFGDQPKTESRREAYERTVKKGGWGTGFGPAVEELGGQVTDVTGSPIAGGVTNFLANAVPAALTSGRMAISSALEGPARWLMQNSVKPSVSLHTPNEIKSAMGTMLKENIYPTPGGMEKAGALVGNLNKQVDAAVANSPATVKVSDITARLDEPMQKAGLQWNPQSDVAAVEDVWNRALTNPLIQGKSEIPVKLAHDLKKGTYRAVGDKAYGELGSASIEAQKALARGSREEVAAAVPSIVETLKREASLMNVRDVAMLKSMQQGNNNPLGLAALRMDHLPSAAMTMADRIAAFKAFLAMQAYGLGKPHVLGPLGVTGGVLAPQDPRGALYSQ